MQTGGPRSARLALFEGEEKKLREFLAAIEVFTSLEQDMPIQMLRMLLLIALNEYANTDDLKRLSGLAYVSKHIGDWTEIDRHGRPGPAYVDQKVDPRNRKCHQAFLTEKGHGFVGKLLKALKAKGAS